MRAAVLALALVGCGKADTDSTSTPTGTASGTPVGTTSAGSGTGTGTGTPAGSPTTGWAPTRYAMLYGWFGVRGGQAVTVSDEDLFGTPIPQYTTLGIRLADDSIDGGITQDNHCEVVFTADGAIPAAAWTAATDAWFALEIPTGAALTDANCRDLPLALAWANPAAIVGAHRWGMGVSPVDQADLDALFGTTTPTGQAVATTLGAGWWTSAAVGPVGGGTWVEPGAGLGQEIDASGRIVRDGNHDTTPLPSADVPDPGGVVDGWYAVTPLGGWRPASELLAAP